MIVSILMSDAMSKTVIFHLKSQGPLLPQTARIGDKKAGHQMVIENIRARATLSQSDFIAALVSLKAEGRIEAYRRFWITNAVSVTGSPEILAILEKRSDIEAVFDDIPIDLIAPVATGDADMMSVGPEAGIKVIKAPEVWELGLDGSSGVVCNFDTGVDGDHPALMSKYRGNNGGNHSECWFDPYTNTLYPIDNHGHGTHTMGTMVGSSGGDTVGVAPGAQWIAAAVVDRGGGIERSISDILAAFEWAADPDGDPSTTDDVPDVVNNSWGIPLGYYPACDQTFWEAIDNLEAAGVVCLFAAGNEGPYQSTIRTPADRVVSDFNCFSVGAINGALDDFPVASFSSRGPSGCDNMTIKPEVTAPGVAIRSTSRTGGYVTMSGTSMAAPHVAGAVAILRQFNPNATPSQIKQALMYSATDLGWPGEDNNYGWGVIDIRRALYFMPPPEGIFPALVSLNISGDGIADPGEEFELGVGIENLGRPARDIVANLTALDPRATVLSGDIEIDRMDHLDTLTIGDWLVSFGSDINIGERLSFNLHFSYSGGTKDLEFAITAGGAVEPGVATHDNGQLAFSISNIGQFGLGPESLNPLGGEGFRYPADGLDFLRNGSLVLATDIYHVSDGAISPDPDVTDDDFAPAAGGFPRIIEPGIYSDQDGFAIYSDSAAEDPIGLLTTQRSFCWTGQDAAPFVTVEFTIENISGVTIESLYVGIFCDWDLPLSSGSDDIVGYIDYESLGYVTDLSTRVSVGVKAITSHASSYAAIDNTGQLEDGFTDLEKFSLMISGFDNVSYSIPGNYSHLITVGPYRIYAGESEVIAFAFVAGDNLDELIANAETAFLLYPGLTGIELAETLPESFSVITNYPNPFNGSTIIEVSGDLQESQVLNIYDIAGRLVSDLPLDGQNRVVWDGTDRNGVEVAAGIYFARVSNNGSAVGKMIFLK